LNQENVKGIGIEKFIKTGIGRKGGCVKKVSVRDTDSEGNWSHRKTKQDQRSAQRDRKDFNYIEGKRGIISWIKGVIERQG